MNKNNRVTLISEKLQYAENALAYIAAFLLIPLVGITLFDALARYIFKYAIIGTYELSEIFLTGVAFLSISFVQRLDQHVNVSIITDNLQFKWKRRLRIFVLGMVFIILIGLTIQNIFGAINAIEIGEITPDAEIPLGPVKAIIPIGFGLASIRVILQIVKLLTSQPEEIA